MSETDYCLGELDGNKPPCQTLDVTVFLKLKHMAGVQLSEQQQLELTVVLWSILLHSLSSLQVLLCPQSANTSNSVTLNSTPSINRCSIPIIVSYTYTCKNLWAMFWTDQFPAVKNSWDKCLLFFFQMCWFRKNSGFAVKLQDPLRRLQPHSSACFCLPEIQWNHTVAVWA